MKSKKDDDGGADGQGKSSRAAPSKQGKSVPREGKGAPATEEEARQEPVWESKGGGLYMHGPTGVYYERPWVETSGGRKRTFRSLGTCNERQALGLLNQRRGRAIEARLGKGKDPYAKKKDMRLKFVSEVLKKYAAAGYARHDTVASRVQSARRRQHDPEPDQPRGGRGREGCAGQVSPPLCRPAGTDADRSRAPQTRREGPRAGSGRPHRSALRGAVVQTKAPLPCC